jgi:hypothetical protein
MAKHTVERLDFLPGRDGYMDQAADGDYVRFIDYAALARELTAARDEIGRLHSRLDRAQHTLQCLLAPTEQGVLVPRELIVAGEKVGSWLSAATDDTAVCAEMKRDAERFMSAMEPYLGSISHDVPEGE